MKKCIIIAALAPENIAERIEIHSDDLILCADVGYTIALAQNIIPHGVIGDFDSAPFPIAEKFPHSFIQKHSAQKDETDVYLCYQYGKNQGYHHFVLLGGIGGRADHTFGNIQMMAGAVLAGEAFSVIGKEDEMTVYAPGRWKLKAKEDWKLSLFSYAPISRGISLTGVAYPLVDAELTWDFPLGVSNQWSQPTAELQFTEGLLLVILSNGI